MHGAKRKTTGEGERWIKRIGNALVGNGETEAGERPGEMGRAAGVAEGPWDLRGERNSAGNGADWERDEITHTPPRGLPHSDSPIRMSK